MQPPPARFLDLDIGQPHSGEAGQAMGQMHLNGDGWRLQTIHSPTAHQTEIPHFLFAPRWCMTGVLARRPAVQNLFECHSSMHRVVKHGSMPDGDA
jgi:hypothetical protein